MSQRPNLPTRNANLPSFIKSISDGNKLIELRLEDFSDTNIQSTSSFRYDPRGEPLKSTQQLNVDWSKFENHTFFMPAEAKVNITFDTIINGFPFDGTRTDVEAFFDKLTGFEKWVYDQFPKSKGYLQFSGSYINIIDNSGGLYPEITKPRDGSSVLNPKNSSFSIECQLNIASIPSQIQVICQKYDAASNSGYTLYLSPGSSTTCDLNFVVCGGSTSVNVSTPITKGTFTHIVAEADRDNGLCRLNLYSEGELLASSKKTATIGYMPIDIKPFTIATGSTFYVTGTATTPAQLFNGYIDELRVFSSKRSLDAQKLYSKCSIFSSADLLLYYRFNEPDGLLSINPLDAVNSIVLDSSGNGLHAIVQNFTSSFRITNDVNAPLTAERSDISPVLFPAYSSVVDLNENLLTSASLYDDANPNTITKLIPQHYLLEGQSYDGLTSIQGSITDAYNNGDIPGSGQLGSTQIILTFLYIYAKMFDELKVYIDQFVNLGHTNYAGNESTPNTFLYSLAKQFGFDLPPLFNEATIQQYVDGDNINGVRTDTLSLRGVQDELMRRIIVNLPKIIKSKGTLYSIKAFMRAVGIDPDNSVRIREYGGPTSQTLTYAREKRFEPGVMAQFYTSSLAVSPYLSASRIEPGLPTPHGPFASSGISTYRSDGLMTSGSWTYEGTYRWNPVTMNSRDWSSTQSLVRMCVTGSNASRGGVVLNLIANSGSNNDCTLQLFARPGSLATSPILATTLYIPSASIFDADRWAISVGNSNPQEAGGTVSSSYYIRVGKAEGGDISHLYATTSYFYEGTNNAFRSTSVVSNPSGSFLVFGQAHQIISGTITGSTGHLYLNNTSQVTDDNARLTSFQGRIAGARFWSKSFSEDEWKEHVRNYHSAGVTDPLVNYNFNTTSSGSWGRLRLETFIQQDVRQASAGTMTFIDDTLNNLHLCGTGFPNNINIMSGETFDVAYLSPNFDEGSATEKVRIRGYQSLDRILEKPWSQLAPVYEVRRSEKPNDDTRFVIEFSLIDALNRDIVTMFSTFDAIESAIGAPEMMFCGEYPSLRAMRDIYFNRISEKLNFRAFFDFYRWFDTAIGTFIEQLVPRKTNFRGMNFTIESHMLERHKLEYYFNEMYLNEDTRPNIRDVLLLQQLAGVARKY